jgi:hypothetical protein
MTARIPEFTWTFFAFFVTDATFQYWFGDGPSAVIIFGITISTAAVAVAAFAALVSDLIPGTATYFLTEISWERKFKKLYGYGRDDIALSNWMIEND